MTDCIAIRTHRWGTEEERLVAALTPVFGDHVLVAFHNRPEGVTPSVPVADFDDEWVQNHGLRLLDDYGWRCGDYALYALRARFPDYERYWLIEPDVMILGDVETFFAQAGEMKFDGIGVDLAAQNPNENRFTKGLTDMPRYRATFALTRFSGRAIDHLLPLRQAYSAGPTGEWRFTNDETFCFSHLMAAPGFSAAGMAKDMPDWFSMGLFDTDPDLLDHSVVETVAGSNQVCHPVRGTDSFIGAVSTRIARSASGFMQNMALSFKSMSDAEIEALGQATKDQLVETVQKIKRETAQ